MLLFLFYMIYNTYLIGVQMTGISTENLIWISHYLFIISRNKPKINLQRLTIEYVDAETNIGMAIHAERYSILHNTLSFKSDGNETSVFINPVVTSVWLNMFRFLFSSGGVSFYYNNYFFFLPCLSSRFFLLFSFFICLLYSFQGIWRWCYY
jgi:hypothetical protein